MKKLLFFIGFTAIAILGLPFLMHAQDTANAVVSGGSDVLSELFNTISKIIPSWVTTMIECLVVVLPAVQFILKKIPTPASVKIGGVLGKVLDFLTFFQKDTKAGGGLH
ncbi:MAG: hypothetical protein C0459_03395 [Chitinophaga sp.]|jgi:uncharacterized membrane-anchored protein YitT (DUF2179 family)|nr:hypothetical protein [Chitinophaga sp.]